MKKFLTSLLALFACCSLLSACSIVDDVKGWFDKGNASESQSEETSSTLDSVPDISEEPSEEDPHVAALNAAKSFIYGDLIEKDLEVSKDYTLLNSFYSPILDETLTVSWSVDVESGITLVAGENAWTVDVDEFLTEDLFYKLTCTISDSDGHTATFTLDRKVLKAEQVIPEKITEAPVENTAYKLYMYQVTKKSDLYFTGAMSGFYLATTNASKGENYSNGVDVYVENVEGKEGYFYIYFNDAKGVKQYFGISNSHNDKGWHVNAIYSPTNTVATGEVGTFEFTWSEQYGTFIGTVEGITYEKTVGDEEQVVTETASFYFGTYSGFYTIGTSHVDNFENDDACIAYLVKMVDKSTVSAEDKVAAEKTALSITTAYSGEVSAKLPTQGTTYGDVAISWAVKSGDATVENNVLTVAAPTEETTIVLTATLTCGEATTTTDVEITVYPKCPVTAVTEPVEGTAYTVYMYHTTKAKNYYFTGKMDGDYLGTTDNAAKAADIYIENAENGFKIYVLNADNSKSYLALEAYKKEGKNYLSASISLASEGSVFTFNKQFSTLCCAATYEGESDTFFLGTYGDYTTISASGSYYMTADKLGTEQFYATFGIIDETALPPVEDEPEAPVLTTPEQILNALYALKDGESLEGPFTLTGTITAIDNWKNPTFVVEGFEAKPVYCFKLVLENANVGDTITVTAGSMKNHQGTYEFMNCTLDSLVAGGGEITPPEGGEEEQPLTTSTIATIIAGEEGAKYQAEGTVVGVYARGFILKDSTGMILVYKPTTYDAKLGDKVTVVGNSDVYNGGSQFAEGCVVTVNEAGSVDIATAESMTGAQCDEALSLTSVTIKYVSITGTLDISGNYYNVTMDGATTAVGSIAYPSDEIVAAATELNGEEIVVEGYFFSISKSSGSPKYINILATSVKAVDDLEENPGEGEEEECTHNYVDGVCTECGAADPDYKPEEEKPSEEECTHNYVDGVCTECGAADPDYKPEEEKPAEPTTPEEILNALYALADGESLEGEFTLTGTIINLDNYKNPTIVVDGFEKQPVYCYYFSVNNASIGDTLTVTATGLKNYGGTYEFTNCTLVELVPHTHTYESVVTAPTCTAGGYTTHTCSICEATYKDTETDAIGHTTDNGTCGNCGQEISAENPGLTKKNYTYSFTESQFSGNETKTLGLVAWTLSGDGGYWGYDATKGQQFGSKNKPYKSLTLASEEFKNVSKITINTSGASSTNAKCIVYVGETQVGTITLTSTANDYSFDVAGVTGAVKLVYTQTSTKAIYIKTLTVDYAE